jgi:hypothetical protein
MGAKWGFAKAGTLGWWWKVADGGTIVIRRSVGNFQTLEDCMGDARKHGYVLQMPTAAPSVVEPAERVESTQPPDRTLAGSAPANAIDPIAIYIDVEGDIIIRQQHAARPIESVITIPLQHAYSVIEAIQQQVKGSFVTPLAVAGGA